MMESRINWALVCLRFGTVDIAEISRESENGAGDGDGDGNGSRADIVGSEVEKQQKTKVVNG
jgi:hypothetical protein